MSDGFVAVVGENVADAVVETERGDGSMDLRVYPGGGPANTAAILGQLGTSTKFLSRIPQGVLGRLFHQRMANSSVDMSLCVPAQEPATLAIASVGAGGAAMYDFYVTGTADWQWTPDELGPESVISASCIHTGSLALIMNPGGPVIERLLASGRDNATISIDPNVRTALVGPGRYRAKIATWCKLADIIRVSHDDLRALYPQRPIEDVFDEWHDAGATLVIVTRAEQSTLASFTGTRLEVPTASIEVVDTIGAGDAFTAGLIHTLHQSNTLGGRIDGVDVGLIRRAIAFGCDTATAVCRIRGASFPEGVVDGGRAQPSVQRAGSCLPGSNSHP